MSAPGADTRILAGFGAIAADFDLALCDVWGVLHAGVATFKPACEALTRFRADGGRVILISNAPRPGDAVLAQLDALGVPRAAYDGLATSGDVTRKLLEADPGRPYFWLGPARDGSLFAGLAPGVESLDRAAMVVCTGLIDDTVETPADYAAFLREARSLGLPLLCANPDLVVDRGGRRVYCAGALGEAYAALGGQVIYAGKPDTPIYRLALDIAAGLGRLPPLSRIVAIGDALRTDIAGAAAFGCRSLFIAEGIHAEELDLGHAPLSAAALRRLFSADHPRPDFAMDRLAW